MENITLDILIGTSVTDKHVGHINGISALSTYRTTNRLFYAELRTERALVVTFMTINLVAGNVFRFFGLKIATRPGALQNPINHLTLVDEIIKAVR